MADAPAETSLDHVTAPGELTAVVVDWNLPEYTIRCVESLVGDGVPADRVVVVENGPTAENWDRIRLELSGCVLVRIEANVGFARANNIGARSLQAAAYLFVNNDAFVHRAGAVSSLREALEPARVGIVVPTLLNADLTLQPSVVPFTTPLPAFVRAQICEWLGVMSASSYISMRYASIEAFWLDL